MAWGNSFFFLLVLTGITGSAAYITFKCLACIAQKVGCVEVLYYMMKGVSVFSLLPIGYFYYKWVTSEQLTGDICLRVHENIWADVMLRKLLCVWVTGAGIVGMVYCLRYLRFCKGKTLNIPFQNPEIESMFYNMYSNRRIKRVRIYKNFALESPCVMGVIRPILVLPEYEYEKEELKIILAHEATHIVCRDNLWKAIGVVIAVLGWWNPLFRTVLLDLEVWAEIHCDYLVCKKFLDGNRKLYATTLVKAALGMDLDVPTKVSRGGGKQLLERIRRLSKCSVTTKHIVWGIVLAAVFAVASSTVAVSAGRCMQVLETHVCQKRAGQSAFPVEGINSIKSEEKELTLKMPK